MVVDAARCTHDNARIGAQLLHLFAVSLAADDKGSVDRAFVAQELMDNIQNLLGKFACRG